MVKDSAGGTLACHQPIAFLDQIQSDVYDTTRERHRIVYLLSQKSREGSYRVLLEEKTNHVDLVSVITATFAIFAKNNKDNKGTY
jgi:hypothetical protein